MNEGFLGIIPEQAQGKEIEVQASVQLNDETAVGKVYHSAKKKLLNVNEWHKVAGMVSANFHLVDRDGQKC